MEGSTAGAVTRTRAVVRTPVRRALLQWTDIPVRHRDLLRDLGILAQLLFGLALCFGVWPTIVRSWRCFRAVRQTPRVVAGHAGQRAIVSPV
jgi:hypothetical protein